MSSMHELFDGSVIGQDTPLPRKVERRCPRCHRHAYHWLAAPHTESNNSSRAKAGCVNCGHEWPCRVMEKDL